MYSSPRTPCSHPRFTHTRACTHAKLQNSKIFTKEKNIQFLFLQIVSSSVGNLVYSRSPIEHSSTGFSLTHSRQKAFAMHCDQGITADTAITLCGADNQSGTYSYFFGDFLDFATMPLATTRTTRRTPRARGVRRELAGGRHRRHVARLEELGGCVPFLSRSPSGGLTPAHCPIQTPYFNYISRIPGDSAAEV